MMLTTIAWGLQIEAMFNIITGSGDVQENWQFLTSFSQTSHLYKSLDLLPNEHNFIAFRAEKYFY